MSYTVKTMLFVWLIIIIIKNNNNNIGLRTGLKGLGSKAHLGSCLAATPFCIIFSV